MDFYSGGKGKGKGKFAFSHEGDSAPSSWNFMCSLKWKEEMAEKYNTVPCQALMLLSKEWKKHIFSRVIHI